MTPSGSATYRLCEVAGLELEYGIVGDGMRPLPLVDDAFREIRGRPTSEIEYGQTGFSNELAAHVFELKTLAPAASLARVEADLHEGILYFSEVLREGFGARLLPCGMHPLMEPREAELWSRAGRAIYEAYARIFPIREHGWLNVQSCHVNLSFGTEPETVRLYNATACLLPYLPALAASSPVYQGRLGDCVDNRLAFYRTNQRRIPEITGEVIPEYIESFADYRRSVLGPIYRALDRVEGGDRLRHEWVNSRGAILRFARRAIEIRVLDVQECVKADVAVAVFVRAALRAFLTRLETGALELPEHELLVRDFKAVVQRGGQALVRAPHFPDVSSRRSTGKTARDVLLRLYELSSDHVLGQERAYLPLIESRIRDGNLSERIRRRLRGAGRWTDRKRADAIRGVYGELSECLIRNTPWRG